jgi:2-isopropylmalate synthase
MEKHQKKANGCAKSRLWSIPYLPVDPTDFGFFNTHIWLNSQSGKGGVAYLINQALNLDIPPAIQNEFHRFIQEYQRRRVHFERGGFPIPRSLSLP